MLVFLALLVSFSTYLVVETAEECNDGDIRMTNETANRNRDMTEGLQICVVKKWATICQNRGEDGNARVACRQLGKHYAGSKLNYCISLHLYL